MQFIQKGRYNVRLCCDILFFLTNCQLLNGFNAATAAHWPQPTGTFRSFTLSSIFFSKVRLVL